MGHRMEKLWRGLKARDIYKKAIQEKTISKSKKNLSPGRVAGKLFGRYKKVQQVDVNVKEPMSSSRQEPVYQETSNTTSSIDNAVSLHPLHETEGRELPTIEADEVYENANTVDDVGKTRGLDRSNLRQLFGAENPVLPLLLKPRRLRVSHAVEFDHLETVKNQEDDSDGSSTKSSKVRAWKEVVATMERSHQGELMDLREDMEALQAKNQEEIDAANSKKLVLQRRVKRLLEERTVLKNDLEFKNETIEQAVAATRHCQDKYDSIEKKYTDLLATIPADYHRQPSSSAEDLLQENIRLLDLVASLSLKNEECNTILQSARGQTQQLEGQLAESLDSNRLVTKNLLQARDESDYHRNRTYQLQYALEQQPGKYADVDREIELRDHRYSVLELKAGECLTAMSELEKKCLEGHKADCAEVTELKTRLQKQDAEIASLKASKDIFQRHSEEVTEKLAGRVLPSNLLDAMNEYFQLVIEDNGILKRKVEEQLVEISGDRDRARLLAYDNQSLKTQQILDQEIQSELKDKIRVQDNELGRLELKIDCVIQEHLRDIEGKNSEIANLQATNDAHSRETDLLARATDTRDIQHLVQTKNHQIAGLNAELNNLRGEKWALEQNQQAQIEIREFEAVAACLSDRESEQLKIRLGNADEELRELRERLREYEF